MHATRVENTGLSPHHNLVTLFSAVSLIWIIFTCFTRINAMPCPERRTQLFEPFLAGLMNVLSRFSLPHLPCPAWLFHSLQCVVVLLCGECPEIPAMSANAEYSHRQIAPILASVPVMGHMRSVANRKKPRRGTVMLPVIAAPGG